MVFNNILETIGKTPLIRLNNIVLHVPATVYAKVGKMPLPSFKFLS